jgi:hypothetical protein
MPVLLAFREENCVGRVRGAEDDGLHGQFNLSRTNSTHLGRRCDTVEPRSARRQPLRPTPRGSDHRTGV